MYKILCIIFILIFVHTHCECPKFQEFIDINESSVIQFVGPSTIKNGRVQGITNGFVSGPINRVAVHPKNSSVIYIATSNAGVWKTHNALNDTVIWKNLTSNLDALSIGSVCFDYSDENFETLIAGVSYSENEKNSYLSSLYITRDGGKNWESTGNTLQGQNIVGVGMYGNEILACSSHWYQGGIFRSNDTGKTFVRISRFPCTDLISSYSNPRTFFAASLVDGILEIEVGNSTTINKITPPSILDNRSDIENIRISYHKYENIEVLYAGFLTSKVEALWRASRDSNNWKWTEFEEPTTEENDKEYGLHPANLGMHYFSIVADPKNSNLVYLGGDHQPSGSKSDPRWPNSIGARDHVGRLFQVNTIINNFKPITNINTKSNTAPHPYSKHSVFDANGDLIEVNSGGIYKLSLSQEESDWVSLNGNLSISEVFSASYLGNNYYAISTESTGIIYGKFNESWYTLTNETTSYIKSDITKEETIMYWSLPHLKDFKATTFKFSNNDTTITHETRNLLVNGKDYSLNDGPIPIPEHVNFGLNRFSPNKIFFGIFFDGYAYESTDGGRTVNEINIQADRQEKPIHSVVYGGIKGQEIFEDLVIAVGQDFLAIRESSETPFRIIESFPPAGIIDSIPVDVDVNPQNWEHIAVVFSKGEVSYSNDGGLSWKIINPPSSDSSCFSQKKIVIVPYKEMETIVVGGQNGVFVYRESKDLWYKLTKWANVQINDLKYDYTHNILYVGTLGYGVWELSNASDIINQDYFKILPAPRPNPNYRTLTWVFAGLTTVLILISIILVIALFRKHQSNYETVE